MPRFDVVAEIAAFAQAADLTVQLLDTDPARLARRVPSVSGWSPLEHAAHLTLANELVLKNLASLAKGSGMLVQKGATQVPEALAVLEAGALPRGARAPRMVVPPADVDLPTTREWAADFVRQLAAFRAGFDPAAAPADLRIPHQILGALDLCEWARFGGVHARHHLAIAREVLAANP